MSQDSPLDHDEGQYTNCNLVRTHWSRYFNDNYTNENQWCQLTVRLADEFSHQGIFQDMITYRTTTNSKGYAYYSSLDVPIDVQELCEKARDAGTNINNSSNTYSAFVGNGNSNTSSSSSSSSSHHQQHNRQGLSLSRLGDTLVTHSALLIRSVGLAIEVARANGKPIANNSRMVQPRFFNLPQGWTDMKQIKANHVNLFVALRGNVVRASNVRPKPTSMDFKCEMCDETSNKFFVDGRYEAPTRCGGGEGGLGGGNNPACKNRKFVALRNTARTVDFQQVKLQELGGNGLDAGRIPRTLQIELNDSL